MRKTLGGRIDVKTPGGGMRKEVSPRPSHKKGDSSLGINVETKSKIGGGARRGTMMPGAFPKMKEPATPTKK